jgi:hypothetical protein
MCPNDLSQAAQFACVFYTQVLRKMAGKQIGIIL